MIVSEILSPAPVFFCIGILLLHFLNPVLKEGVSMGLRRQGAKANVGKAQLRNFAVFS